VVAFIVHTATTAAVILPYLPESMRSSSSEKTGFSALDSEATKSAAAPDEYVPERVLEHRVHHHAIQYLVKWKSRSDSDNTWEDEDELSMHGGGALIVDYHRHKSLKPVAPKKVARQMEFDILFGYKFKTAIYYRIRFENGVESDKTSDEVQKLNLKKLVDFLEGGVTEKPDKKAMGSP
jgi:hypothetical protein